MPTKIQIALEIANIVGLDSALARVESKLRRLQSLGQAVSGGGNFFNGGGSSSGGGSGNLFGGGGGGASVVSNVAQSAAKNAASSAMSNGGGGGGGLGSAVASAAGSLSPGVIAGAAIVGTLVVAGVALKLFADKVNETAESINHFRAAMLTSGGTRGETAKLGSMGNALGLDISEMAQMSRTFASKIASDPQARMFAGRAGIQDLPGAYGKVDKADNLLEFAKFLRSLSEPEAIRAARAGEVEGLLKLRDVSDETIKALEEDAKRTEELNSPERIKQAAELSVATARMSQAFQNLWARISGWAIPILTGFVDGITAATNALNEFFHFWHVRSDEEYEKTKDNINALNKNTSAVNAMKTAFTENGVFGGGSRAQGAMPSGWQGTGGRYSSQGAAAMGWLGS